MLTLPTNTRTRNELVIKRSRFITTLARTDTEEEARTFITDIRTEFPDARHHCSAYIVSAPDAHDIERSSDDGEPSGTAGTPMLDVLKGESLTRVTAVVTRYFGGILLGAGGLVHAYSQSVSDAVATTPRCQLLPFSIYHLTVPHADAGKVEADIRSAQWEVITTTYSREATIVIACPPEQADQLATACASITKGSRQPEFQGSELREVAL